MKGKRSGQGTADRHLILEHNLSGVPCVLIKQLHKEYEEVRARETKPFIESMGGVDGWTL